MFLLRLFSGKSTFSAVILLFAVFSSHLKDSVAFDKEDTVEDQNEDGSSSSLTTEDFLKDQHLLVKDLLPTVEDLLRTELARLNQKIGYEDKGDALRTDKNAEFTFLNNLLSTVQDDDSEDEVEVKRGRVSFGSEIVDPLKAGFRDGEDEPARRQYRKKP